MGKKDKDAGGAEALQVLVRCRPLFSAEREAGLTSCVELNLAEATVTVKQPLGEDEKWTFDAVINQSVSQRDIFVQHILPLVDQVLAGFNATVFAYGMSGAGKSFSMLGDHRSDELMGVIPRTFRYIFEKARQDQETHPGRKYQVSCGYIELYNNMVRDLLAEKQDKLDVKENKDKTFFVRGALQPRCTTVQQLITYIEDGAERRQVASTGLNNDSSRSHSIFTLYVEMVETTEDGDVRSITSKINMVDLAGSERQSKTGATGDTLKEGCNINLSLTNLGTVIDCIVKGKPHIPYRSNPLTMLLKDGLGGNSKTVMFANIRPTVDHVHETISTLRFADRAKQIKNKPTIQLDVKDQKIKELTEAIQELRDKLKMFEGAGVKGLEDELEATKEKLAAAEAELANAEKSREADRGEFVERLRGVETERDELSKLGKELQLQLAGFRGEKDIVEQRLRSEVKRRADWKEMLAIELGLPPPPPPSPGRSASDLNTAASGSFEDGNIDAILAAVRDIKTSYIDPEIHHNKVHDLETRRKSAEQQAGDLTAQLDALRQELSEATMNLEQATKKGDRLKERLDREKESRRQIADTDTAVAAGGSANVPGLSPGRSFRRQSAAFGSSLRDPLSGSGGLSTTAAAAEVDKLEREVEAKTKIIDNLREQLASNQEVKTLEAELQRSRAAAEERRASLQQQVDALTASLTAPNGDDSQRETLVKKALLTQDTALRSTLAQAQELEKKLQELLKMRAAVAIGDVRVIESDVIGAQGQMRQALVTELHAVAEQRNQLLLLSAAASSSSDDAAASLVKQVVKENEKLRKQQQEQQSTSGGNQQQHAAETSALRAALADQKRAGLDAVAMVAKQSDELRAQIATLEEAVEQAEQQAMEKFLAEHKAAKEQGGDDGEDEDPLRTALRIVRKEKASLTAEMNMMSRELQASKVELALRAGGGGGGGGVHSFSSGAGADPLEQSSSVDEGSYEALRNECLRLRAMLGTAASSPAASAAGPKSPMVLRSPGTGGAAAGAAGDAGLVDANIDLNASFQEIENNIQSQVNAAHQQMADLKDDLEKAREELLEATERRDGATKERAAAQQEAADAKQQARALQQQLDDATAQVTGLQEEAAKARTALEAQFGTQIMALESKLRERGDQLGEQAQMVERQTALAASFKERCEMLQASLTKATADAAAKEKNLEQKLEQQEAQFQKMVFRRLEEQKEQHQQALIRKDEENYELRKKLKKLEDKVDRLRQAYDEKVCEYEEMASAFEEQKVELQKAVRNNANGGGGGGGGHNAVSASRDKIDDSIRQAREERKRTQDAFYDISSASSSLTAAHTARPSSLSSGGGGTNIAPPIGGRNVVAQIRSEINSASTSMGAPAMSGYSTTLSSAALSARPSGSTRVLIDSDTYRGGGAGYSSSMVAPSSAMPVATSLAPLFPLPPPTSYRPDGIAPPRSTLPPVAASANPFGINFGGTLATKPDDQELYDF